MNENTQEHSEEKSPLNDPQNEEENISSKNEEKIEEMMGALDLNQERQESMSNLEGFGNKNQAEIEAIAEVLHEVKTEIQKIVIGQEEILDLLMIGLFTGGNILLEGVPGIAKTLTAKMLAKTLKTDFVRIQFTPDLMPADIIGTMVYNLKTSEFEFKSGPIFSNVVLIDEINRAPAKTQAALMEVMEERQVTIEGVTHKMGDPFFVIATQNPVEQEGTYKLPEAQMDRFLFKLRVSLPELEDERAILNRFKSDFHIEQVKEVNAVLTKKKLKECKEIVQEVNIKESLLDYIAKIVVSTRNDGNIYLGASPRASLSILKAAKALALLRGRYFVIPEDVKFVAPHVLNHRIILSHEKELEGIEPEMVIKDIIESIEIPR
ncbi:MAG: MoxR family ATPase [Bacteroidota bacterium]